MLSNVWAEIKKPSGIFAIILALFVFIIGLFFTGLGEKHGSPTYDVQQVTAFDQAKLGDADNSNKTPIYAVNKNGDRIYKNVYVATLKIWNYGNANIKSEDVRVPFKIVMSGTNEIIKFDPTEATENNMDHFSLSNDESHVLSWTNFDPKQGVAISIVYAAKSMSTIQVEGYAVNSDKIIPANKTTIGVFSKYNLQTLSRAMVIVIGFASYNYLCREFINKFPRISYVSSIMFLVGVLINAATFSYLLFLLNLNNTNYAPF